jgi:integrase
MPDALPGRARPRPTGSNQAKRPDTPTRRYLADVTEGPSRSSQAGKADLAALSLTLLRTGADGHAAVTAARQALARPRAADAVDLTRTAMDAVQHAAHLAGHDQRQPGDVADPFPWHTIRPADLHSLAQGLATVYAPAMATAVLSAARGIVDRAVVLGHLSPEARSGLTAARRRKDQRPPDVRQPVQRKAAARPDPGDPAIIARIFVVADQDTHPNRHARNACALALLYGAGLRRAEAASVRLADVDRDRHEISVVGGKGARRRSVPLARYYWSRVQAWLAVRPETEEQSLLLAIDKDDQIQPRPLGLRSLWHAVNRLADAAGLPGLVPQDLRRAYALALLDLGGDYGAVGRLLGHTSIASTARYDYRGPRAAAELGRRLPTPRAP